MLFASIDEFFINNETYFKSLFEKLQAHSNNKGWIQGNFDLRILMTRIFFEVQSSNERPILSLVKAFLNDFTPTNEHFIKSSNDKAEKHLKIIDQFLTNFNQSQPKQEIEKELNSPAVKGPQKKWWEIWR